MDEAEANGIEHVCIKNLFTFLFILYFYFYFANVLTTEWNGEYDATNLHLGGFDMGREPFTLSHQVTSSNAVVVFLHAT